MTAKALLSVLCVPAFFSAVCGAQEGLKYGGYAKTYVNILVPSVVENSPFPGGKSEASVIMPLRARLSGKLSENITFESAYEVSARFRKKNASRLSGGPGVRQEPSSYRAVDFNSQFYPASDISLAERNSYLFHNLDRFLVRYSLASSDFYIGRQPVSFGSSRVINPTDVIAPFSYGTIDREDRYGSDAVVSRVPLGEMSALSAGAVFGKNMDLRNDAFFVKAEFPAAGNSVTLTGMYFSQNLLAGFDLQRSIRGAGFWLEAAWVETDAFFRAGPGEKYARLSTGADYSFGSGFYGLIEYHYNGAGAVRPGDYSALAGKKAYREGGIFLLGRHYFIPSLSYEATPLVRLYSQALFNAEDGSSFFFPKIEYNLAQDLFADAGALISLGRNPVYGAGPFPGGAVSRSEFGMYPGMYYFSLRCYF